MDAFDRRPTTISPRARRATGRQALLRPVLFVAVALSSLPSRAEAARPRFQAPFPCAQVWDASTYCNDVACHFPDPDSIDLTVRDHRNRNVGEGEPVLATADGEVIRSDVNARGEHWIVLDHGDGWTTHYVHMAVESPLPIKVGRRVGIGEQIGRTSNSGAKAVHQHYAQVRNNEGRRVQFAGRSINTHEGNKASYGTWGSTDAEKILSHNCVGNFFPGWYQNGVRYHQIYKPGTGLTKILKMDVRGAAAATTWQGSWSRGWTHFIPYYQRASNHPHLIVYKSSTGLVSFNRMKLNGKGVTHLKNRQWWKGWTHFVSFTMAGHPHFLAYDSVHGHANIDRIHPTGDGTKSVYKKKWGPGRTQILTFKMGPTQYLFLYEGGTGKAKISQIVGSGNTLNVVGVWADNWTRGYTNIVPVSHEGAQYLLAYKSGTGLAKLLRINRGGKGVTQTETMTWTQDWTAFSPFGHRGKGHLLAYKGANGQVTTLRLKTKGRGVERLWSKSWTSGWK